MAARGTRPDGSRRAMGGGNESGRARIRGIRMKRHHYSRLAQEPARRSRYESDNFRARSAAVLPLIRLEFLLHGSVIHVPSNPGCALHGTAAGPVHFIVSPNFIWGNP